MSAMPCQGNVRGDHVYFRVTKLLWREASYIAGLGVALVVYVWIGTTGKTLLIASFQSFSFFFLYPSRQFCHPPGQIRSLQGHIASRTLITLSQTP